MARHRFHDLFMLRAVGHDEPGSTAGLGRATGGGTAIAAATDDEMPVEPQRAPGAERAPVEVPRTPEPMEAPRAPDPRLDDTEA
jgi:hypothetical protein